MALRSDFRVEVITRGGGFHVTLANGEITEAFTLFALLCVSDQDRLKLINNLLVRDRAAVKLVEALAIETGT